MKTQVSVSIGEMIDKLTILEIKLRVIKDADKWTNIQKEWAQLSESLIQVEKDAGLLTEGGADVDEKTYEYFKLINGLRGTNQKLWDIEDEIRDLERRCVPSVLESVMEAGSRCPIQPVSFYRDAKRFVELARLVYITNDQRCKLKKELDIMLGSELTEEKSYKEMK